MTNPAIQFEKVSRYFGDVKAVDAVDLEIRDGEFFSMLGPSGSGKTTCLRMIAGFDRPTSGKILLYGQEVDTPTGVAEEFGAQLPSARLRVSPNPAGAGAMLEITPQTGATGAVRVRVYDAAMREAARYDATISGAETLALPLDASALPAGAYIICAGGSGWSAAVPFAVER